MQTDALQPGAAEGGKLRLQGEGGWAFKTACPVFSSSKGAARLG